MKSAQIFITLTFAVAAILFSAGCARPKFSSPSLGSNSGSEKQEHSACDVKFSVSGDCVSFVWETVPASVKDYGSFLFKIYRLNKGDGSMVLVEASGTVVVQLWMPSMGHGSSPVTVEHLDVGTYRAKQVLFIMPGQWEIRFQIVNEHGQVDQAIQTLTF
jgi:hypothetical protein